MKMKGCRLIQDFIVPSLREKTFGELLKWDPHDSSVFMLRWVHKAKASWSQQDAAVFLAWDGLKGRVKPKTHSDFVNSKQRLRAALRNVKTVREVSGFSGYRRYRILALEGITGHISKSKEKTADVKQTPIAKIPKKQDPEDEYIPFKKTTICDGVKPEIKIEKKFEDFYLDSKVYSLRSLRVKKPIVYFKEEDSDMDELSNETKQEEDLLNAKKKIKNLPKEIQVKPEETKSNVTDKKTVPNYFSATKKVSNVFNVNCLNMNVNPPSELKMDVPTRIFEKCQPKNENSYLSEINICKSEVPKVEKIVVHDTVKMIKNHHEHPPLVSNGMDFNKEAAAVHVPKFKIEDDNSLSKKTPKPLQVLDNLKLTGDGISIVQAAQPKPRKSRPKSKKKKLKKFPEKNDVFGIPLIQSEIGPVIVAGEKIDLKLFEEPPNYKWDPQQEPLPRFFDPGIELVELLMYLNDEILQPNFMKELNTCSLPPF